jgi:hypothetical protein
LSQLRVKSQNVDDVTTIDVNLFGSILDSFGLTLTDSQKKLLLDTFPSTADQTKSRIVIDKLFEIRFTDRLSQAYTKVHIGDTDDEETAVDTCGYTGNFHRQKVNEKDLKPISMEELILIIYKDNHMLDIMRRINEIDKEHNGYVTSTELDDIIKLSYPKLLADTNLKKLFKPYVSI